VTTNGLPPELDHPSDEAALYNPAFLALLLSAAAREYEDKSGEGMPWSIAFLVLPMTLPGTIRSTLPQRTNAYLSNWTRSSPLSRLEVAAQASALAPFVREALRFGLRHRYFVLHGYRLSSAVGRARVDGAMGGEAITLVKASRLVGRWLSKTEPPQVFAQLGLRP
jgi:hypothetical protein